MWNLWYITFGLLLLTVIGLTIGIVLHNAAKKYLKLYKATYNEARECLYIDTVKSAELRQQYQKYDLLHDSYDGADIIGWAIATFGGILFICFLLICIFVPVGARKEVNYFIAQKEYVEMAIANGSELENVAITQIVIEQNQWLANAKASVQTYGAWSKYYGIDFSKLSPIEIKRGN